jgi:hypothetical protein
VIGGRRGGSAGTLFRSGRADLAALLHEHDVLVGLVAVDEAAEALAHGRRGDGGLPFALVGVHHLLHLGFQLGGQAQAVVQQHALEVVQPAFEVVAPGAGALQAVGGAHVEHQEAVDQADQGVLVRSEASSSAWRGFMPPLPQT